MIQFKRTFTLPTPDFQKWEFKELTVRLNINAGEVNDHVPEYSITLPDIIFDELKDTEPQFATKHDWNNHDVSGLSSKRSITKKFQKTQTSTSIDVLKEYVSGLTQHILDKHSVETSTEKKKIFIYFNHQKSHDKTSNGAYLGEDISQSFRYFIGYEVMTDKFSKLLSGDKRRIPTKQYISKILYRYNIGGGFKAGLTEADNLFLPLCDGVSMDQFEAKYSIIDWTPEREAYCEKIKQSFIKVNAELSKFLKDMTNEKVDELMQNNYLALNPVNQE